MSNPFSSFVRGRSAGRSSGRSAGRSAGPSAGRSSAGRSSSRSAGPSAGLSAGPSAAPEDVRVIFFLPMLDETTADEWYYLSGVVPLIPRNLDKLVEAYLLPLHFIIGCPLNQAGKVEKVYVHLGIGGFFEFNPKSNVVRDCNVEEFEALLRNLLQNRELAEQGTDVMIAREIKTTREVNAIYADLRVNYYKIGCVCGPRAKFESSLYDQGNGMTDHASLMFMFGKHVDFMWEEERLVDTLVLVSKYDMESYSCVIKVVDLVAERRGIL